MNDFERWQLVDDGIDALQAQGLAILAEKHSAGSTTEATGLPPEDSQADPS